MTLNLAKCDFARREGHCVGSGTHRPDPQRLEGITKLARPQTKKYLRKVLGAQEDGGKPIEMQAQQASSWDDSLAGKTKRYDDTLKRVLPQMPKK